MRDARRNVPAANFAKNNEDEMRHKLLQISSRGVQIPCTGRYLNSFRGVCDTLFKMCIRGNSGFRSDVGVRGPRDLVRNFVGVTSHCLCRTVARWPWHRPKSQASRENHAARAGRLSAKVARVIDTLHCDPVAASPLSLVTVEGTRHWTRGTERRPIIRDIRSGRDLETPPSNGGLVTQQSELGQGPGPAS